MGSDKTALENLLGKPFTDNLKDLKLKQISFPLEEFYLAQK